MFQSHKSFSLVFFLLKKRMKNNSLSHTQILLQHILDSSRLPKHELLVGLVLTYGSPLPNVAGSSPHRVHRWERQNLQ